MRPLFFFFLVFGIFVPTLGAQEVSNMMNSQIEKLLSSDDFPNREQPRWSVDKATLQGGMQSGVELITIDNGHMKIVIIPTRGMSIYRVSSAATSLGWDSPVKQIVNPQFVDLNDQGGLGWLAGFNEMMVRCGVEFAGHPGEDDGKMLTLHGRIGNIPATRIEVSVDNQAPHRIRVRGTVEEKRFKFGVFDLQTEISTLPGSREFTVTDRLVNRSEYAKEYQMIYHSNFGRPILQKGAQFLAPVASVAPFDEYAAKDLDTFPVYLGPTKGYGEQVYCLQLHSDEQGRTAVALINENATQGVRLNYDTGTLPFFTLWKNTDTETDGYVTGLEPGTGYPYNRSVEREEGRVPQLEPGGEVKFQLDFELLENAANVESARREIEKIAGGKQPVLRDKPPIKEK
ncbi:MAG: aldose 1-epimerase family protein [Pirellulaceae bacterium]|nr:aldose 1-epimerase family protein [Pirellulaceae bacterium]